MADDVVLNTPLIAAPVKGKTAIRRTVEPLLGVVDAFDFREIMLGPEHVSSFFKITVERAQLDGMDYWLLDSAGLIKEMTVLWRPLPAAMAVRDRLTEMGHRRPRQSCGRAQGPACRCAFMPHWHPVNNSLQILFFSLDRCVRRAESLTWRGGSRLSL
jgi:hypothetical protein